MTSSWFRALQRPPRRGERSMPSPDPTTRLERVRPCAECVVAHAQEGEIVGDEPFQELDGLGDLVRPASAADWP